MPDGLSYVPGSGTAFIGPTAALFIGADTDTTSLPVEELWSAVVEARGLQDVVEAVLAVGLRRLPSLAALHRDGTLTHLLVRGGVTAELRRDGAPPELVTGENAVTWVERAVDGDGEIEVDLAGAAAGVSARPERSLLGGGVVDVARVRFALAPGPAAPGAVASPAADPPAVGAGSEQRPLATPPPEHVAAGHDPTASRPWLPSEDAAAALAMEPDPGAAPESAGEPQPPADELDAAPADATQHRPLQAAAPMPDGDGEAPPAAEVPASHETVIRPRSTKASARSAGEPPRGPLVHGILCPTSHANPPQAILCRVCNRPLEGVDAVTMPRPVLGRLVFSNGTEVDLDRPVVVGRSPRAEGVSGDELPQLVTVPSPDQEVSRSHLAVRLDGWDVLVVDLGSTNGTVVTLPGQAPERLRAGEEYPITPGTVVAVADETSFVYEVTG